MTMRHRVSFICLTVFSLSLTGIAPPCLTATAATLSPPDMRAQAHGLPKKAKQPRKKRPAPVSPIMVHDFRIQTYPDHTRLVLDLQRSVTFTQNRLRHPDRLIIELQNSRLAGTARARLTDKTLPEEIAIAQPHAFSVTLSLNLNKITDYKLLPLSKPDRLVLDVYNRSDRAEERLVDLSPSLPPSKSAPAVPPQAAPSVPVIKSAQRPARGDIKLIVLDPGHGGKDPGAIGRNGIAEKDVTLHVALKLRELLGKRLGTQVLMTRDRNVFVELGDRAKFANSHGADLFVSIHVNAHPQRSTKGLEVYHFGEASDRRALEVAARENGISVKELGAGLQFILADLLTTKKIEQSQELAWSTKQAMVTYLGNHYDVVDHGVKTAPFYVIRFTTMPSILAEIAFISNPTEERLMQTDAFLTRMAEALFEGIKAYVAPLQTASR
ncbi:MAG TPA: N-acetylmuramoyl-L-alanine amidase [Nitrospiraceae bacterium]|jgi:N-acetylmuramoyl-L-alanine amidase|nr:N-acetylmuramoyl-L-alanine amidase [Nitrospiraceae bacterium]